jgi:hypothetical protein
LVISFPLLVGFFLYPLGVFREFPQCNARVCQASTPFYIFRIGLGYFVEVHPSMLTDPYDAAMLLLHKLYEARKVAGEVASLFFT